MAGCVTMQIPRLELNAEYSSISELNYAVRRYEDDTMCKLYKRRTRTIVSAIKRAPKRVFNEAICFTELYLCCVHGGMKFRSQSTGKRPNLGTVKKECPFMVTVKASKDGQKLVIYGIQENHNHSITKKDVWPSTKSCALPYPYKPPENQSELPDGMEHGLVHGMDHGGNVEKIRDKRTYNGQVEYVTKWKGHKDEENTWKTKDKLNNPKLYRIKKHAKRWNEDDLKELKRKSSFWEWEGEYNRKKLRVEDVQLETPGLDTAPSGMDTICQTPIQIKEEPPPYILEEEVFTSRTSDEPNTMHSQLCLNATYSSISELKDAISLYEQHNLCKLYKRRSRSIAAALKRTPKKTFNLAIAITELELCCIHGGKTFKSRSTGKRPNRLRTSQTACPFIINVKASIDGQKLVISRMDEKHNHVISKVPIRIKGESNESMEEPQIDKAAEKQSDITKKRIFKVSKEGLPENLKQFENRMPKKTTNLDTNSDTSLTDSSGDELKCGNSQSMAAMKPLQQNTQAILVQEASTFAYTNATVIDSETRVTRDVNDLADSDDFSPHYASFIQKNIFG